MVENEGIALTLIGTCGADGCRTPLFAELLTAGAPGLCLDCAPLSVERRERFRGLFERSGGRLPAGDGRYFLKR